MSFTLYFFAVFQRNLSEYNFIFLAVETMQLLFQKFLQQTGGHRGGWDEYDQGTFLKFRNRYKVSF